MKISENSNYIYKPKFKAITLTENERNLANNLINKLPTKQGKDGLFKLFEKHITNEAKSKSKGPVYIYEDVLQALWLEFLTTLETIRNLQNPLDVLCKVINDFKPGQEELNPDYKLGEVSLDKKLFGENEKLTLGDTISTGKALNPLSYRSEEERQVFKDELETELADSDLTDKEKELIRLRAEGKTYDEIATKDGVSHSIIRLNILTAIAKVQNGNNILPQEYTNKAKELIEVLELKKNIETVKQWLIEHPEILPKDVIQLKENIQQLSKSFDIDYETMVECGIKQPPLFWQSPETIEKNVRALVKKFEKEGLTTEDYLKACVKQPPLFYQSPETIEKKVRKLVTKFEKEGLTIADYIKACVKQPQLFYQSPETIEKNVKELVKKFEKEGLTTEDYLKACIKQPPLFCLSPETIEKKVRKLVTKFEKEGLTIADYIKACVKQPQLFCQSPETIEKNVRALVKKFEKEGLTTEDYLKACVKQPQLFYQSPETIEKNVKDLVKKFEKEGLTTEDYLKACIKQPQLFCQSPETIEKNVKDLVKKFEKEGLTTEDYLKACVKQPQLFYQSPETIEKNVKDLVKKFEKEGLTVEDYLKACVKQPQLFYQSPETIEKNVKDLVKKFEKEGLTTEDYLKACVKQPPLFYQSPETIEKNVKDLVKKFEKEGLTTEDYLKACVKQPQLFCQSPETIAEHVKAYMYIDKNNLGYNDENVMSKVLRKHLAYSNSLIYMKGIILPQLKKQDKEISKWGQSGIKANLEKYFTKHPDKQFTIRLVEDEMADNCIQTIQEFCNKTFKRDDMFEFERVA